VRQIFEKFRELSKDIKVNSIEELCNILTSLLSVEFRIEYLKGESCILLKKMCGCDLHQFPRVRIYLEEQSNELAATIYFEVSYGIGTPGCKVEVTEFVSNFLVLTSAILEKSLFCHNSYFEIIDGVERLYSHIYDGEKYIISDSDSIITFVLQCLRYELLIEQFTEFFNVSLETKEFADDEDNMFFERSKFFCDTPRKDYMCYKRKDNKVVLYRFRNQLGISKYMFSEDAAHPQKLEVMEFENGKFVKVIHIAKDYKTGTSETVWIDGKVLSTVEKNKEEVWSRDTNTIFYYFYKDIFNFW